MDGVGIGAAGPASADVFSSWPPLAHIEQLKAELASLRPGERQAMERVVSARPRIFYGCQPYAFALACVHQSMGLM